ncbi:MAG: LamG-like jellyroll fold domain-containing protein [Nitrospiraceae bacterium]
MSLIFDDASNEMLIYSSTPVTGAPFSIVAFVNADVENINADAVSLADASADDQYFALRCDNTGRIEYHVQAGATAVSVDAAGTLVAGTWQAVVIIERTTADRSIWTPGDVETTDTTSATPTGIDRIGIGGRATLTLTNEFSDKIAFVGIYDVALTAHEAKQFLRGADPYSIRRPRLKFYVPCNQPAAKSRDVVGGQLVGTVQGSPTLSYDNPPVARLGARVRSRLVRV